MIAIAAGIALAASVLVSARLTGFERDRSFYPTVLIVIALLYVLFAAIDGRPGVVVIEAIVALLFCALAVVGHRQSTWWLIAGFALHGGFDLVHPAIVRNAGVPDWWPPLCLAFDGVIAVYLGLRFTSANHAPADGGVRS